MSSPILKLVAQRIALGLLLLFGGFGSDLLSGTHILPATLPSRSSASRQHRSRSPICARNSDLNDPAYVRYFRWLGGVLTGDLGTALSSRQDIATSLGGRFWNTLFLAFWAAVVAVPRWRSPSASSPCSYLNGVVDKPISGFALASTSLPEFFVGYLLIFFVAVKLQWLPSVSTVYDGMAFGERMKAIALPATALTFVVLAHMMRMTRAAILNVMQSAYIETAELKGLRALDIIRRHAFPNAVAPIVNVVMLNLAFLVVGVVVVEVIFVYRAWGSISSTMSPSVTCRWSRRAAWSSLPSISG